MICKMELHSCLVVLSLTIIFQWNLASSKIVVSTQKSRDFHVFDDVLATLFQECNISLQNIMIFDNSSSSTAASILSNLKTPIGIKLKSLLELDKPYLLDRVDPIEIQGMVVVINKGTEWPVLSQNIEQYWELRNGCMLFLVFRVPGACPSSTMVMQYLAKAHFANVFYICVDLETSEPVIYSHDIYGDRNPSMWPRIQQSEVNLCRWTLYRRIYKKSDTCEGFSFNRTTFSNDTPLMVAVSRERHGGKELVYTYTGDPRNLDQYLLVEEIITLERILNTKFIYYVYFPLVGHHQDSRRMWILSRTPVNVFLVDNIFAMRNPLQVISHPTYHDNYAILSKAKGPATPLEKIANFYGTWTLISLMVILFVSFIVIRLRVGRRMASAFFDILRLLINSGIVTPINTLPMKIFFSMIFMYFIVIHSTFSGNLAKFLTVPEYLANIDSLDDLADSSVKVVNSFFYRLDEEHPKSKSIAKKFVHRGNQATCWNAIINSTNDVCIGPYWPFRRTIMMENATGYYLSKNMVAAVQASIAYRQRLPLIEKFDWALMALSETRIYHRSAIVANEVVAAKAKRMDESKKQDFRPISINDIKFAFILLIIGNGISLIVFMFELLANRSSKPVGIKKNSWVTSKRKKKPNQIRARRIQVRPIEV